MTAPNSTRVTRLKAAGWVRVEGWLPADMVADHVSKIINGYRHEAERIAATPGKRGRPKQGAGK